jgi:hypothetical protein
LDVHVFRSGAVNRQAVRGPLVEPRKPPVRPAAETPLTTRTGLLLPEKLPMEEWQRVGQRITAVADSSAWWLGDWLIYGRQRYPDRYRQAVKETTLDYQTLRNYAWVAGKIPQSRRRFALSFQHYAEVATLPEEEQDEWLGQAEMFNWSRRTLREKLQAGRRELATAADAAVVRVMVDADADSLNRWQDAANRADRDLREWIRATLDRAAADGTTALN